MPLYEYSCQRCGQTFEVRQKFSDKPLKTHEGCGGAVERLLSPPALQFKGSGWYVTDYGKNGGSKPAPESKAKPESKTESKSETKSESKPSATPPTSPASKSS